MRNELIESMREGNKFDRCAYYVMTRGLLVFIAVTAASIPASFIYAIFS